jgi:hypothetical protein
MRGGLFSFLMTKALPVIFFVIAMSLLFFEATAEESTKQWTIVTGPELGDDFPPAVALRVLLEKTGAITPGSLRVFSGRGSIDSINNLRSGSNDLAIVSEDAAYNAQMGQEAFSKAGPFSELRVIAMLQEEALTLVAMKGEGIRQLNDIAGRRVYLGPSGSSWRMTAQKVIETLGPVNKPEIVDIKAASTVVDALCNGEIDAAFALFFHPSPVLSNVMNRCFTRLIPLRLYNLGKTIRPTTLAAGLYPHQKSIVAALGQRFALVSRSDFPDSMVVKILTAINTHRSQFCYLHPVLIGLLTQSIRPDDGIIPLHPAAAKFFASVQETIPK